MEYETSSISLSIYMFAFFEALNLYQVKKKWIQCLM